MMDIYSLDQVFVTGLSPPLVCHEQIVGEELGILPGMDSIFSVLALEKQVGFLGTAASKRQQDKFDLIVYDGISSEETLRFIGGSSKARF